MTVLAKFHAARHALAVCKNVDEVKTILDKAEAMRAYGVMAQDKTLELDAIEIRLRAERRLGEMIGEQKANGGLSTGSRGQLAGSKDGAALAVDPPDRQRKPTLADAGISKDLSSRAQNIAAVPEQEFEQELSNLKDRTKRDGKATSTRLVERGKEVRGNAPEPVPEGPDLAEIVDEQTREIHALQEQVEALQASDLTKQLAQEVKLRQHAVREKDAEMDKNARLAKERDTLSRWQSQVVSATGQKDPKAALAWIKSKA